MSCSGHKRTRHTPLRVAFAKPWPATRRGFKLWVISVAIGIKGIGYLLGGISRSTDSALRVFTDVLGVDLRVCGAVIVALCLASAFTAYCHHGRDRYGYAALTGFCCVWSAAFFVGAFLLDGPASAVQGGVSYLVFAGFLLTCAGDPEPVDTTRAP